MVKVGISGGPGTGTSTLAKALALELDCPYVSTGGIAREMAEMKGWTIEEFVSKTKNNIELHKLIDEQVKELAKKNENIVVEGRGAGYYLGSDVAKIKLIASPDVRAERISIRENIDYFVALAMMTERELDEFTLFKQMYNLDLYNDYEMYDMILNTDYLDQDDVLNLAFVMLGGVV